MAVGAVLLAAFAVGVVLFLIPLLERPTRQGPPQYDLFMLIVCMLGVVVAGLLVYFARRDLTPVEYDAPQAGSAPQPQGTSQQQRNARQAGQPSGAHHQQQGGKKGSGGVLPAYGQAPGMPPDDPAQQQAQSPQQLQPSPQVPQPVPFQQLAPAQFEKKKPDDPNDPYPDEVEVGLPHGSPHGGWAIVGSSRRGFSHEHEGKYREDGMAFDIVDDWHLVAIADGGGAYTLARLGANVAVEQALAAMKDCVQSNTPRSSFIRIGKAKTQLMPREVARRAVLEGFRAAYDAVAREAAKRGDNVDVKQLRATLLLLAHRQEKDGTHVVAGGQIGDGILVARHAQDPLLWLGKPDTGPTGNEVIFLQDVAPDDWPNRVVVKESLSGPGCHFLVMTDGVADDFLPIDDNLERLEKPLFESVLAGKSPQEAAPALTELLGYQRAASFDDRTLVCIYELGGAQ